MLLLYCAQICLITVADIYVKCKSLIMFNSYWWAFNHCYKFAFPKIKKNHISVCNWTTPLLTKINFTRSNVISINYDAKKYIRTQNNQLIIIYFMITLLFYCNRTWCSLFLHIDSKICCNILLQYSHTYLIQLKMTCVFISEIRMSVYLSVHRWSKLLQT